MMGNESTIVDLDAHPASAPERPADVLPQAHEAEQAVLGGLLLAESEDIHNELSEILAADDFYSVPHQLIYRAFLERMQKGDQVDVVAIAEALTRENELEKIGGLAYLQTLADNTPMVDTDSLCTYARIVLDAAMRRRLIAVSRQIANSCMHPEGKSWEELLDMAENKVIRASEQHEVQEGPQPMSEVLQHTLSEIQSVYTRDRDLIGLPTGFPWLDRTTSGLQRSDLVILAGRPSTGKTALAMNIVQNIIAEDLKQPVVVFSIEMSNIALMQRLLAAESGVPLFKIRNGKMSGGEYEQVENALARFKDIPFFLDTSSTLSPIAVRRRVRRIMGRQQEAPALVVVDYLQLMTASPGGRAENRNLEVAQISRDMKALAKEFDCPMLLLSQLNRGADRASRAPNLSDLRDSGAIEQDADLVLLLHPAADSAPAVPGEGEEEAPAVPFRHDKEIILNIAKHRNGPTGKNHLLLHGETVLFKEMERPGFQEGVQEAQ